MKKIPVEILSKEEEKKTMDSFEEFKNSLAINTGIPNKRDYSFPFRVEARDSFYHGFKHNASNFKGLNNKKKIKRFVKHYYWWDYYFTLLLVCTGMNKQASRKFKYYVASADGDFIEHSHSNNPKFSVVEHANQESSKAQKILLAELKKANPNYIEMLADWFFYCACEYYYFGSATDSYTKPTTDSLLKSARALVVGDWETASETIAYNIRGWWD